MKKNNANLSIIILLKFTTFNQITNQKTTHFLLAYGHTNTRFISHSIAYGDT